MSRLRAELKRQLLTNPSTLEEQKKLIKCVTMVMWSHDRHVTCVTRYLLDLDYLGDPACECIVQINTWILGLLRECKDTYQVPVIPGEGGREGEGGRG